MTVVLAFTGVVHLFSISDRVSTPTRLLSCRALETASDAVMLEVL